MKRAFLFVLIAAFSIAAPAEIFAGEPLNAPEAKKFFASPDALMKDVLGLIESVDNNDFGPVAGIGIRYSVGDPAKNERAVVQEVMKGRPADKAGVQKGDTILSLNGKPYSSSDEFRKEVRGDNSAGRTVTLELSRDGAKVTATMTTVLLSVDRTSAAKLLRQTILTEGAAMVAKLRPAFAEAVKAIDAGANNTDDPRFSAAFKTLDEFDEWLFKKDQEIDKLLEVK